MKIAKTAPSALNILWSEEFFVRRRTFEEVRAELERRGYHFTKPNLAMALGSAKFLTRLGKRGAYTYVQKHPYIEEEKNGRP
jgi:hypothetical protein